MFNVYSLQFIHEFSESLAYAISPDEKRIIVIEESEKVVDYRLNERILRKKGFGMIDVNLKYSKIDIEFDITGKYLFLSSGGNLYMLDSESFEIINELSLAENVQFISIEQDFVICQGLISSEAYKIQY